MTDDDRQKTDAPETGVPKTDAHPGMMGDGTEEQNLGQPGDASARITQEEVEDAFKNAEPGADTPKS